MSSTPSFPPGEYLERLGRVRAVLAERGLDVLLVTSPENICYLTGYATPGYHIFQCLVVPAEGDLRFVVRNTEVVNVPEQAWIGPSFPIPVSNLDDPMPVLAAALRELGLLRTRVGFDDRSLFFPPRAYLQLVDALRGGELVPASGVVEACRALKSPAEVERIRAAVHLAEQAIVAGAESLATAATDSDVAAAVVHRLATLGSEYTGSPAYVTAGGASLRTHATHARRPIVDGETVRMEVSASIGRYHGASTRLALRGTPSQVQRDHLMLSAEAIRAMIDAAKPGVAIGEVDRAGRSLVESVVPASYWPNRGAYSMGISFPPGLGEGDVLDMRSGDERPVEPGMVFHLLPTLRVPGVAAIGCTETICVTEDGCASLGTLPLDFLSP